MEVIWSPDSMEDLDFLFEYIAEDSVENAMEFIMQVRERANALADVPRQGRKIPELDNDKFREVFYKEYTIVYEIQEDCILIHEIYNQRRIFIRTYKRN
ncbi:MAG: type II toxin-antitoxin system RelE/ParE family toxin [Lachnospiraceae bacterium]|jgi:plasmid stabilization system protein ParE|nr:type II toxin-antitoxin system RelE/ParE family toxin [Lachnospiraceae bacterium]MCR4802998.1 type II toxin-antitoxin system RelE/ParE family toxin [Lachnospiraceae bacterium]